MKAISRRTALSVGLLMLVAATALAQQKAASDSPEAVIKALVHAMYANDVAAYERLTVPDPRRGLLVKGGKVNEAGLKDLEEDPEGVQIRLERDFAFRGKAAQRDAKGAYPIGTTVLYMVAHRGGPMIMNLVSTPEGWKVDLRWWLAMVEMSTEREPSRTTPAFAARALAGSLLKLDRQSALRFAMPGSKLDVLFAGAPPYREPSGHLDALVFEMPIIEIGPGEFFEMPSGRVVEGVKSPDVKVLVGQMGMVEFPFVVRRVGTEWRVEAEPYFLLLNR